MTKQELLEKTEEYNTKIGGLSFKNQVSSSISDDISTLGAEWNTTHGIEIVNKIKNEFKTLEEALNEIEVAVQSIKDSKITTTFQTSESQREV